LISWFKLTIPFTLRPARPGDDSAIHVLIHAVGINPTGLDWRRFIVAVLPDGRIIACGQVKPHRDGSHELASIAVVLEWRGRGAARTIIERLIAEHPGQLHLTCRASLGSFYERFGFVVADETHLPAYFRRLGFLARLIRGLGIVDEGLLIMERSSSISQNA
jgi:N-acetylglutamate synthase-like GNAT family acetyltransferase